MAFTSITSRIGRTSLSAFRPGAEDVRVVDISDKPVQAKVVREGYQVPPTKIDPGRADFFLDNLVIVAPQQQPRVVSQTIPAGTRVTPGTVVDLVMAPRNFIPFDIFDGVHADLRGQNIAALDSALSDPDVRQTLLGTERAEDVPDAERSRIIERLGGVANIDEANPERNFASAFNAARYALAFR